jgi:hypothetical protein
MLAAHHLPEKTIQSSRHHGASSMLSSEFPGTGITSLKLAWRAICLSRCASRTSLKLNSY